MFLRYRVHFHGYHRRGDIKKHVHFYICMEVHSVHHLLSTMVESTMLGYLNKSKCIPPLILMFKLQPNYLVKRTEQNEDKASEWVSLNYTELCFYASALVSAVAVFSEEVSLPTQSQNNERGQDHN